MNAKQRRDIGIQKAAANAENQKPGWSEMAMEFVRRYLRRHKNPFLWEEVREWAESRGLPAPPDKRAWGGISIFARRAGLIEHAGVGLAKSSNLSLKHKWRKAS